MLSRKQIKHKIMQLDLNDNVEYNIANKKEGLKVNLNFGNSNLLKNQLPKIC